MEALLCTTPRKNGNTEIVRVLVKELSADVNAKDGDESTPLHLAAFYGRTETARVLVEQGADVSAKDSEGNTPFNLDNEDCHREELRVLLRQRTP